MKASPEPLDFEVDKLINSIENTITGEAFDTEIARVTAKEKRLIKKSDWLFDWHLELTAPQKQIFSGEQKVTLLNLTLKYSSQKKISSNCVGARAARPQDCGAI